MNLFYRCNFFVGQLRFVVQRKCFPSLSLTLKQNKLLCLHTTSSSNGATTLRTMTVSSRIRNYNLADIIDQHALKNVSNCLNTNIYSYFKTSGGQSSNLYLNVAYLFYTSTIRHPWQLKTVVFLHWRQIRAQLVMLSTTASSTSLLSTAVSTFDNYHLVNYHLSNYNLINYHLVSYN